MLLRKQKASSLLVVLTMAVIIPAEAFGITLAPGQSLDFSFDNLLPAEPPGGLVLDISFYWWPPLVFDGYMTIDFYEDANDTEPFHSDFSFGTSYGITADIDQWNDLNGRIVINVIDGSPQFDSLTFAAIVDGQYYSRTYDVTSAVPVPSPLLLFVSALIALIRRPVQRKNENCPVF